MTNAFATESRARVTQYCLLRKMSMRNGKYHRS